MLHTLLQVWGGTFYLLNKIFFSRAERNENDRRRIWRIRSWMVYLIGLPAWLWIFVVERNWIAFGVEAGGSFAMALGLMVAIRGIGREPQWLKWAATLATSFAGIGYSLYVFSGITTWNQVFELFLVTGFLVGTILLAYERSGYPWYMLMNIACGVLMFYQHYPWLALQQAVSFCFVLDAYRMRRRAARREGGDTLAQAG